MWIRYKKAYFLKILDKIHFSSIINTRGGYASACLLGHNAHFETFETNQ